MHEQLARQLAVIRGGEPAGYFELRMQVATGMRQAFVLLDEPERLSSIVRAESPRRDVYLGAAPRSAQRGTADAVRACWCVWADCDTSAARKLADDFEIPPSLVVESGSGGAHYYWSLLAPAAPAEALIVNKRLVGAFQADPRSTDPARILRPVGSLNHKHTPPRRVGAVHCDALALTTLEALDVLLPKAPEEPKLPQTERRSTGDSGDYLKTIPADEYVPRLTGREVGRDRKAQCPFHGGGEERTPSLHVYGDTWTCYGCAPVPGAGRQFLGGGIYQLAALVYGYPLPLRGTDYLNVRRELEQLFIDDPDLRTA